MSSLYEKNNKTFEIFKRILFCTIGAIIIGFNIKSFVRTGGLFPGGFAGITLLIQRSLDAFLNIQVSYTLIYIPLNMIPIYIGIKWLGKNFTFYSIYVIVLSSIVVDILPDIVLTYDILLIAIFGGIINGVAIWICLLVGASAGGTDFISIYFSEKRGKDAWNYILLGNVLVLTVAGVLFGVDKAMSTSIEHTAIHHACFIVKNAHVHSFLRQPRHILSCVALTHAHQHHEPLPYFAKQLTINSYRCAFHSLNYNSHSFLLFVFIFGD